jgi:uncharacterized Tic20 family protein
MNSHVYQTVEATSDEKLLALFSHLSIFMGGIILPLIFWAVNKDKSRFVRFHSLQAVFFHIAYIVLIVAIVVIMVIIGIGMGIVSAGTFAAGKNGSVFIFIALFAFYAVFFLTLFLFIGYGIYVGIKSYKGELAQYPVIGKIVYDNVYGGLPKSG